MNQEEINELLALAAITAISPPEIQSIEELATASPEIDLELRSLRNVVSTLAYNEKPLAVPASLKHRLFDRIQKQPNSSDFIALRSEDRQWQPHPIEGLLMVVLKRDLEKRQISSLIRATKDVEYPAHHHKTGEEILMLAGELIDRGVTYRAGDYLYSEAGSQHAPIAIAGCMFFVCTSLDDTFI
ncbi:MULTISPECIES: cupin domain-containing protein [Pseudanabaena]|uniref:Anti-ECFsigma factor, ChrR n=2 Tax=Pseudanabaena TaxID=1152 RepID=L8MUN3_9CYAN|nr:MULTISPECIES: cupin domain-containing protein [Pseudanabaena]ELS30175.1 anti-ECFsigma factor, ChrR [Pseudanabaena biceps PCC 7429]MDG3497536.1 cupin domain-containing protein [Pseudanabaena catenata USMAC16]